MLTQTAPDFEKFPYKSMATLLSRLEFAGGVTIEELSDASGKALTHALVKTMLRIDLPQPLQPGEQFVFNVAWNHAIVDATKVGRGVPAWPFRHERPKEGFGEERVGNTCESPRCIAR